MLYMYTFKGNNENISNTYFFLYCTIFILIYMILKFRFSKISFQLTLTGDILSFRYRTAQELFDDFLALTTCVLIEANIVQWWCCEIRECTDPWRETAGGRDSG